MIALPDSTGGLDLQAIEAWGSRLRELSLLAPEEQGTLREAVAESRSGGLGRRHEPLLTILLLGPTQVGKSQLLNALAGEEISLSSDNPPTTKVPMVYLHEDARAEHLFEYGTTLGQLASSTNYRRNHRREELRLKVLIDAPDIDSYAAEHREAVRRLMPAVDVVLYVVSPQKYRDNLGWQIVMQERGQRGFAFVLNKWDQRNPAGARPHEKDIDQDFRELLEANGYPSPTIFRTCARRWVERLTRPEVPLPEGDQFVELNEWLSKGISTSRAEVIQRRRRRALWGSLAERISKATPAFSPNDPWITEALVQLSGLNSSGGELIRSQIVETAQSLGAASGVRRFPRSPGLFGLYLELVEKLSTLASQAAQFRHPLRLPSLGADPASGALALADSPVRILPVVGQLAAQATKIRFALETKAHTLHFPAEWILKRHQEIVDALPARIEGALARGMNEVTVQARRSVWTRLGVVALVVIEGALFGYFLFILSRLGAAFFLGIYVGLPFLADALFLLLGILLLGHVVLNCCFPSREEVVLRMLGRELADAWKVHILESESFVRTFSAELETLHADGLQFSRQIDAQIESCQTPISDPKDSDDAVNDLFASNQNERVPVR